MSTTLAPYRRGGAPAPHPAERVELAINRTLGALWSRLTRSAVTTWDTVGWSVIRGTQPADFQQSGTEVRKLGWERHPVVNACARVVVDLIQSVPLEAVKRDAEGEATKVTRHPALDLLTHPRPDLSGARLIGRTSMHLFLYGNAFWVLGRRGTRGEPRSIRIVPPEDVQHLWLDGQTDAVVAYDWRDLQGRVHAHEPVENVVHFRDLDATDGLFGFPRLAAALLDIATDTEASQYVRQVVTSHGVPGLAVMVDGAPLPEELRAGELAWREKYTTRGNRGMTAFMAGVKDLKQIGFDLQQLEFPDLRRVSRESICAAAGVDPRMISVASASNDGGLSGEQYREARFRLIQQTVYPLMRVIETELNHWFMPEYGEAEVQFSEDYIAAITEDLVATSTRVVSEVTAKIRTVEEAREAVALPSDMPADHTYPGGVKVGVAAENAEAMASAALKAAENPPALGDGKPSGGQKLLPAGSPSRSQLRFSENQPRDPAGTTTGGQWTDGGVDIKAWAGDSKIVDESGDPIILYRGSQDAEMVGVRDGELVWREKGGPKESGLEAGYFFTRDKKIAASFGTPVAYYVKASAPVRHEDPLKAKPSGADAIYRMRGKGDDITRAWEIAVFDKSQFLSLADLPGIKPLSPSRSLLRAQSFDREAERWEREYERAALLLFAAEARDVARLMATIAAAQEAMSDPVVMRVLREIAVNYGERGEYHRAWLDRYEELIGRTVQVGGRDIAASVGLDFSLSNPRVLGIIRRRAGDLVTNVTDTTREAIRAAVLTGRQQGLGVRQIAQLIEDTTFGAITRSRAQTIARTEVVGALNSGEYAAAIQSGVMRSKTWLTNADDRVRDTHVALNNKTVDIGQAFPNGLRYPHDPLGAAAEVINCRCTLTFSDLEAGAR